MLSGRVDDVLASAARPAVLVGLHDLEAGAALLCAAGIDVEPVGALLRVHVPHREAALVTKLLADHALYVTELRPDVVTLEQLFFDMTEHERIPA